MMNPHESKMLVGILCAAYPTQASRLGETAIAGMVASWADLLADLPFATAKAALAVHARTCKWIPSVAEIREAAISGGENTRPGGDAWGDVQRAVSRYGVYRTPTFEDPVTKKAVEAIGWANLCNSMNTVADRSQFVALYDKLAANERHRAVAGDAIGKLQAANGAAAELVGKAARRLAGGS